MDSILDWLYQCDWDVSLSESRKQQRSAALDAVLQAEEVIKKKLPQDLSPLMTDYLEDLWQYHSLEGQLQFERGLLYGCRLMIAILSRYLQPPR